MGMRSTIDASRQRILTINQNVAPYLFKIMALSRVSHHSFLFGSHPKRWFFVAGRLLTSLVVLAALVQVIPAGIGISQTSVAESDPNAFVGKSLSASTHFFESWMTESTCAAQLTVAKSNPVEPLHGRWGNFDDALAIPKNLPRCETQGQVDCAVFCLVTLMDLGVRLQI